jgi:superfamily II DNA helicase RecQ
MIRQADPNPHSASVQRKIEQLYDCVRYCENEFSCRRTMQLKFFGERFDESKCNKTCDNCKAGKVSDRRDLTTEAKNIIELFNNLTRQAGKRGGGGITMNQLSELFRGSKAKAITKNFHVNGLRGYGAGSQYKKYDIDRITHEMVFEKILTETSTESNVGFLVDYVSLGENAGSIQSGSRKLYVEFPMRSVASVNPPKKSPKAKKSKVNAETTKASSKADSENAKLDKSIHPARDDGGLQFVEGISIGSDDDSDCKTAASVSNKRGAIERRLPDEHTKTIIATIKRLTSIWAEEEQLTGKNVQCTSPYHFQLITFLILPLFLSVASEDWHILQPEQVKSIAFHAPMTIDELKACPDISDKKVGEYGARIVKAVSSYVKNNNLEEFVHKRQSKRPKTATGANKMSSAVATSVIVIDDDDDDEFDEDIDYAAINLDVGSKEINTG